MRVALVCPYDLSVPGGVQSHVAQLADALGALGDDVTVLGPGAQGAGDLGGSLRLPFNGSVAPLALDPRALARTRRALAAARPEIVHVHEPMVPMVGLTAALAAPAPVVATFHAWSDRDRLYRLARPLGSRLRRAVSRAVAVSEPAAAYHARALGWRARDFAVIPNGVDVARFRAAEPWPPAGDAAPRLLFVGRLERRKGLAELVRAYTRVKADHPELRLDVVGEGPERERAEALLPPRLRDDVSFHGRVGGVELARAYATADVFAAPALGGESFGIVLVEAMAAGCAVVASDIPGYRSVASPGVHAELVAPGDERALADAISGLLDQPRRRQALADQGRARADDFDWSTVAGRLREQYRRAIDDAA